jgi:hypothetical protein
MSILGKYVRFNLALQLPFFEMSALRGGLMGPAPE